MSFISRSALLLLVVSATRLSAQSEACPSGNDDVRTAALSSLAQIDGDQVLPSLRKILERRDYCSIALRRQAISLLNRTRFGDQTEVLLSVARNDPSNDLRRYAVQALAQTNNGRGIAALDSIVFTSSDLELRNTALISLVNQSAPAARASVRRAAELTTLPYEVRVRAVNALGTNRRGADETAYLIALHSRAEQADLRDAVMRAIANQRTPAATTWLLGIARDRARDIEMRRQALSAVGQTMRSSESSSASGIDLNGVIALYDDFSGQPEMQDRVLDVISQSSATAATDKLLQVARSDASPELRRKAVSRVGQRKDPRVREFLLEVLSK